MTPEEFRRATLEISRSGCEPLTSKDSTLALYGLGIAGEAGEVADEIKKVLFHGKTIDRDHLIGEVGDVLWYSDRVLLVLDCTMEEALASNVAKLRSRYPGGWDAAPQHFGWGAA